MFRMKSIVERLRGREIQGRALLTEPTIPHPIWIDNALREHGRETIPGRNLQ